MSAGNYGFMGITSFTGLDRRVGAADGAIADMTNISSRYAPAYVCRAKRAVLVDTIPGPAGIYAYDDVYFSREDGKLYRGTTLAAQLLPGKKSIAALGGKLIIFPDKVSYNPETGTVTNLVNLTEKFQITGPGSATFEEENAIYIEYDSESDCPYHAGDIVAASGEYSAYTAYPTPIWQTGTLDKLAFQIQSVNFYNIGGGKKAAYLAAPEGVFDALYAKYTQYVQKFVFAAGTLENPIPDMDFIFAGNNRLWGAKGRNIFASSLGLAGEWENYDLLATSSWQVETGVGDDIIAGCMAFGRPTFFCENAIYKIFGDYPAEYSYTRDECLGVRRGEADSLTAAGDRIYYLSRRGFCAYAGGVPSVISDYLGTEKFRGAVGGTDGTRYFVSCETNGEDALFIFDPEYGIWVKEDDTRAVGWTEYDGDLYCLTDKGKLFIVGEQWREGMKPYLETDVSWMIETADFNLGWAANKSAEEILIRCRCPDRARATVYISYDGDEYEEAGIIYPRLKGTDVFQLRTKRCDVFRVKIEGHGEITIYGIQVKIYTTSEK